MIMFPLLDRLKAIEGYDNTSKVSYNLLLNSQEDIDSDMSESIKRIAPKINKLKSFEIMVTTGKATRQSMVRILKSLLRGSPSEEMIAKLPEFSDTDIQELFIAQSEYWIKELYDLEGKSS